MEKYDEKKSQMLQYTIFRGHVGATWKVTMVSEMARVANSTALVILPPLNWTSVTVKLVTENLEPA
ncbi:hypothetical protein BM1_01673 [Bipolaris maydis]|nr:hypothetical protein BM1_01673 [Bipolaris maydis]